MEGNKLGGEGKSGVSSEEERKEEKHESNGDESSDSCDESSDDKEQKDDSKSTLMSEEESNDGESTSVVDLGSPKKIIKCLNLEETEDSESNSGWESVQDSGIESKSETDSDDNV